MVLLIVLVWIGLLIAVATSFLIVWTAIIRRLVADKPQRVTVAQWLLVFSIMGIAALLAGVLGGGDGKAGSAVWVGPVGFLVIAGIMSVRWSALSVDYRSWRYYMPNWILVGIIFMLLGSFAFFNLLAGVPLISFYLGYLANLQEYQVGEQLKPLSVRVRTVNVCVTVGLLADIVFLFWYGSRHILTNDLQEILFFIHFIPVTVGCGYVMGMGFAYLLADIARKGTE